MTASVRTDIQAKLAEKFWVPCPGDPRRRNETTCLNNCIAGCCGSNRRYPFDPQRARKFNDAPDAIWNAVRAKGWDIRLSSQTKDKGDDIDILDAKGLFLGRVKYDEGYRGQAALELVALRALEAQDDN